MSKKCKTIDLRGVQVNEVAVVRVRVRVRKLYLKSDKVKQCNISSHLKWVLVADKSMHIIKVQ